MTALKFTFFPGSVVGYVGHPEALLTRGVALGLAEHGHDIRIVEERQNEIVKRTLLEKGAEPSRHFYKHFPSIQYHTFEPRSGAVLLEWVTRELALIDVAVAVDGVEQELCRWLGNVTRDGLIRVFMTFHPESLTNERAESLEIDKYDLVLAPSRPVGELPWSELQPAIAPADDDPDVRANVPKSLQARLVAPSVAARQFEQIIDVMRR